MKTFLAMRSPNQDAIFMLGGFVEGICNDNLDDRDDDDVGVGNDDN